MCARPQLFIASLIIIVLLFTSSIQQAVGFAHYSHHRSGGAHLQSAFVLQNAEEINLDTKLDVNNSISNSNKKTEARFMNNITTLPVKMTAAISGGALLLAFMLQSNNNLPSTIISTYKHLLIEYPMLTKSLTSGMLCGISDIIAQSRDTTRGEFNYARLIRFAGKGVVGGYIWTHWYDWIDSFLDLDSDYNIYKAFGAVATVNNYDEWIRSHLAIVTTALSLVIEQFIWCPIVFGSFEIPVSTLLNGGSLSNVQQEVEAKIGGLLVSNAKVWTPANVIIYNVPVEYRPIVANVVDIFWQSIVSDVAADCGKVEDDICDVGEGSAADRDYSFFAEKNRI